MRWTIWLLVGAAVLACSKGDGDGGAGGAGDDPLAGAEPTIRSVDTTLLTDPQGFGHARTRPVEMPPAAGTLQPTPGYGYGADTQPTYTPPTYPAPMRSPDAPVVTSPPTPPDRERPLEPLPPVRDTTLKPAPTLPPSSSPVRPPAPTPAATPAEQPRPVPPPGSEPAQPAPSPAPPPTPPPASR